MRGPPARRVMRRAFGPLAGGTPALPGGTRTSVLFRPCRGRKRRCGAGRWVRASASWERLCPARIIVIPRAGGRCLSPLDRRPAQVSARPAIDARLQPDTSAVRRQPPVRRQRYEPVAVRAGHGPRPQVVRRYGVLLRLRRKPRRQQIFPDLDETGCQTLELLLEVVPVVARPLGRGAHDERRDRIEVVGKGSETEPGRLEGDAPAARRRVEDDKFGELPTERFRQPVPGLVIGHMAERARVAVRLTLESLALPPGSVDPTSRSHRIAVDPEHVQEPAPVRVRRQQGGQHRRPRRHQRTPRPPDVEAVRRGKRRHRRPLARALDADLRDRQPPLDQPDVAHALRPPARRPWVHARPSWERGRPARKRTKAGPQPVDAGETPAFPGGSSPTFAMGNHHPISRVSPMAASRVRATSCRTIRGWGQRIGPASWGTPPGTLVSRPQTDQSGSATGRCGRDAGGRQDAPFSKVSAANVRYGQPALDQPDGGCRLKSSHGVFPPEHSRPIPRNTIDWW